jgi:predicted ABC-type ATPase
MNMDKILYVVAGCNGAGKTYASLNILSEIIDCYIFLNADEIAKALSPNHPESVAVKSGRIMLCRINECLEIGQNFAFETTLSSKLYKQKILVAKKKGFEVRIIFFWLNSVELAMERVRTRVEEGGHNINQEVIKRRYYRGIKNFFEIYLPIVDKALIFDNSSGVPEMVFQKSEKAFIFNPIKFNEIKKIK